MKTKSINVETATSQGQDRKVYSLGECLYLTVTKSGQKSFSYRASKKYETIGFYPEYSIDRAREWIKTRSIPFYNPDKMIESYLDYLRKFRKEKTIVNYEYCKKVICEAFEAKGFNQLTDLKSKNASEFYKWIFENRSEYAANITYPFLQAVFKYHISSGVEIENPFSGLKKSFVINSEYKSGHMKFVKDPVEFKKMVELIRGVKNLPIASSCLLAIVYLPLRPGEMRELKKSDLIDNGETIYIKPENNKTKKHLFFKIPKQLKGIFEKCSDMSSGDYIFPNRLGGNSVVKRDALTRVLEQINYKELQDVHGLRHSFRTIADEHLDLDRTMLEVILGHDIGTSSTENIYNKSTYKEQKFVVLEKWAEWLDS